MLKCTFSFALTALALLAAPVPKSAGPPRIDANYGTACLGDPGCGIRLKNDILTISLGNEPHEFDHITKEPTASSAPRTVRIVDNTDFDLSVIVDCRNMPNVAAGVFKRSKAGLYVSANGAGATFSVERTTNNMRGIAMQCGLSIQSPDGGYGSSYGWNETGAPGRYRITFSRRGDVMNASMYAVEGNASFAWRDRNEIYRAVSLKGDVSVGVFAANSGDGFEVYFEEFKFTPVTVTP